MLNKYALFCIILITPLLSSASLIRLDKPLSGPGEPLMLAAGESVQILFQHVRSNQGGALQSKLRATVNGHVYDYELAQLNADKGQVYLVGPLSLHWEGPAGEHGFASLKRMHNASPAGHGNTISIPADETGEITIAVESSGDLLNWTTVHEGSYTGGDDRRFYRLRASRNISP